MSLTIELPTDVEQRLRVEAARNGQAPEEFARAALEERLRVDQRERAQRVADLMAEWNREDAALAEQVERNRGAIELLRRWRDETPDLEEAEGYPEKIERLQLRELNLNLDDYD